MNKNKIDKKYKWNLKDIYENEEKLKEDIKECEKLLSYLDEYKEKINISSDMLFGVYELMEKIETKIIKIQAYAMLNYHMDMSDSKASKLYNEVEDFLSKAKIANSFVEPEITNIEEEKLRDFFNQDERLKKYEREINEIIKNKKHILTKEQEYVISKYGNVLESFSNIYDLLCDVDFKFGTIFDENKKEVMLTHANYSLYVMSNDENVRKQAYETMLKKYKEYINTITQNYLSSVKKDVITANLRNYSSSLHKAVESENSTIKVYEKLIETVNENLPVYHRYLRLKARLLGVEKLNQYDIFLETLNTNGKKYDFETSKNIVMKVLSLFGDEYTEILSKAFEERWIDVYERAGKYSGGYNMGVYSVHPYILLNFVDDIDSLRTLAHELGHCLHSYFSMKNQNLFNSDYTIMVAEVASTVNEIILSEYLIKNEKDKKMKAYYLSSLLNVIRGTLVVQTMFAEFEKKVHEYVEDDIPLSSEEVCNIYENINYRYLGDIVKPDEYGKYNWARIPHFYRNFYVYKYATGISSAIAIATRILSGDEEYKKRYIEMLKLGGSKDPLELLRLVDVDLETDKPVKDAFKYFEEKIIELENLVNEL